MSDIDKLTDGIKTLLCAGVGAMAITYEKTKETMEELVEKGAETLGVRSSTNEELKHNDK